MNSETYNKNYFQDNKEKIYLQRNKQWKSLKESLKVKVKAKRSIHYLNNKDYFKISFHNRYIKYRKQICIASVKFNQKCRKEVINFLGGKCIRCGFDDWRALQIDHVNGGGTKELKNRISTSPRIYYKDVMANKTGKYQLLCANCNWIKRSENNENRRSIFDNQK